MSYIGRGLQSGAFRQLDSIASSFDGSTTGFTMQVNSTNVIMGDANQILLSLGGVIQNPGTDFTISSSTLTFTTAPATGTSFFAILLGSDNGGTVTPTDGSVTGDKLASNIAITTSGDVSFDGGSFVFNESSADKDFRIESNGNANMLFVSGGNDVVGIGAEGDLGIGLHIKESDSGSSSVDAHANQLVIEHGTSGEGCGISFLAATDGFVRLAFGDSGDDNIGQILYNNTGNLMAFFTNAGERMRIHSDGNISIGRTTIDTTNAGISLEASGTAALVRSSGPCLIANRLTDDGEIIRIVQAGTTEGTISTSGSTVSYNAFTGSHWSRLADNSKPTILRGTIMESLDSMIDWYQAVNSDGTVKKEIALPNGKSVGDAVTFTHYGTEYTGVYAKENDVKHVHSKISTTADSTRVYGVFHCWGHDNIDDVNDMEIAQVGTYIIRVHKDVTVVAGDLLVSNGDGTAKKQDDDIIRSKTVAKVNSNIKVETYSDGSYTVPCTLHC